MSSAVAEKNPLAEEPQMRAPRKGERFHCQKCGMEMQVTVECKCGNGHHVRLECCGQPLTQIA